MAGSNGEAPDYDPRHRPIWTEAERREYRRMTALRERPTLEHPKALALYYFYRLPRPLLALLALVALAYLVESEDGFRSNIRAHIVRGETAMFRLNDVERLASTTASEVKLLREEQMRSRVDQIDFYKWMAEDRGDAARVKKLTKDLVVAKSRILEVDEMQAAAPN